MKRIEGNVAKKLKQEQLGEVLYFPAAPIQIAESKKSGGKGRWKALSIFGIALAITGFGLWAKDAKTEEVTLQQAEVMMVKNASTRIMDTATELASTASVGDSVAETMDTTDEDNLAVTPTYTEETTDARLTNMYGVTLNEKFVNDHWVLGSGEEVLVWMDLPTDIDQLDGYLEVTYPYEVAAGETGVVDIRLTSYEDSTIYTSTLKFVAENNLTLESGITHKAHSNSGDVEFWNDTAYEMDCLQDIFESGKKSYLHFSLYTSSQNDPVVFSGGYSSVGYDMDYNIRAIGDFDEEIYRRVHGGTAVDEDLKGDWLPMEQSPSEIAEMVDVQLMGIPETF